MEPRALSDAAAEDDLLLDLTSPPPLHPDPPHAGENERTNERTPVAVSCASFSIEIFGGWNRGVSGLIGAVGLLRSGDLTVSCCDFRFRV